MMSMLDDMHGFADRYGKSTTINSTTWRYYRLGSGTPIFWLTGGLRRAALSSAFLERLAARHTVIAPDYPPVGTMDAYTVGFDAILHTEGIETFILAGQSYGGLLAQAYLTHRQKAVEWLILSSTGPADYGRAWLPADYVAIALAHLLPERVVKGLLIRGLLNMVAVPDAERAQWRQTITAVLQDELTRADVVSHFAVAADLIQTRIVTPAAYRTWTGHVVALRSESDPTQNVQDIPRYERLFGRHVEVIDLGLMGHAAALFDPDAYVALLEQALASSQSREAGGSASGISGR